MVTFRAVLDIQQTKRVVAALGPNCREPDKVLPEPLSLMAVFLQSCPRHQKKMQTLYSLQCLSAGGKICVLCNVCVLEAVARMHLWQEQVNVQLPQGCLHRQHFRFNILLKLANQ